MTSPVVIQTPNQNVAIPIRALNLELHTWGFTHDTSGFVNVLEEELSRAKETSEVRLDEWVREKQEWIRQGVALVQHMEGLVFGDMFLALTPDELRFVWRALSKVAYEVMYLIVLVEYRLDILL